MNARDAHGRFRVAVTGVGVKSPAGNTPEEAFQTFLAAKSTAATVDRLVAEAVPVRFACLVPPFEPEAYLTRREARQIDRVTLLALCAAADAVTDARLPGDLPPDRTGVQLGTGIGGLPSMEATALDHGGFPMGMPVHTVPRTMTNSPACRIAMRFGFRGSCTTYATACASGTTALGEAARKIRHGELDVALAGGADAPVTTVIMSGFARMRAVSLRNEEPRLASRPFAADRDGFVVGEGAALLVLERWDLAVARGARIHGEITGYADNCDAFHIVAPHKDGSVAAACMRSALADARLAPSDVGHVNAHGTSTLLNDRAEAAAIDRCFAGQSPPVTALKGVTGHLIGGSGALEAALALRCASGGLVPAIANTRTSSEADLVDLVTGAPRTVRSAPVLSNSFGFGGQNACLVLSPAP
ncbi:beta-ketoacyl-[acyl-carrier-protein] synthase family protein [Streptomyces murinus]|uniref:beta-ketoacyl-[acyl-carrier-protein] synthase family protein n=1 Tax=Streptomyces murinus TaxID=33900 RepID=UPI00381B20F4